MREGTRNYSKQKCAQVPYGYKEKDPFIIYNVQEKDTWIVIRQVKKGEIYAIKTIKRRLLAREFVLEMTIKGDKHTV